MKKNITKLKQELLIMKTLNIKPNYSEISRIYGCKFMNMIEEQ